MVTDEWRSHSSTSGGIKLKTANMREVVLKGKSNGERLIAFCFISPVCYPLPIAYSLLPRIFLLTNC